MMLSSLQLEALAAVCDCGTFDQAAAELRVTPSALSQRIASLERRLGQTLVRRTRPITPTASGENVLRLARQTMLLQAECLESMREDPVGERIRVAVAVNADTLSTWFRDVVADVAAEDELLLDIRVEDESRTADLLRAGEVMGAVSLDPHPAQGCSTTPLGTMRYLPTCSPDLLDRAGLTEAGLADLARLPMLRFGPHDDLQHGLLSTLADAPAPPVHYVPSNADFLAAVVCGLGWGAIPQQQALPLLEDGSVVRVGGDRHVDVPLFWHRWRVGSPALDRMTELVQSAAGFHLGRG